jgi:hypothetical protein
LKKSSAVLKGQTHRGGCTPIAKFAKNSRCAIKFRSKVHHKDIQPPQSIFKLREQVVPMKMYRARERRFARVVLIRRNSTLFRFSIFEEISNMFEMLKKNP